MGREVRMAAIVLPPMLLVLEILGIQEVASWSYHDNPFEAFLLLFPHSLLYLPLNTDFLSYAGLVVIPLVMVAVPTYWLRTRGRLGYAFTSFGVVRVRGHALRILRYEDIVGFATEERNPPQYQIVTDGLEISARDGKSFTLYGFGLARWQQLVATRVLEARSGTGAQPREGTADDAIKRTTPDEG